MYKALDTRDAFLVERVFHDDFGQIGAIRWPDKGRRMLGSKTAATAARMLEEGGVVFRLLDDDNVELYRGVIGANLWSGDEEAVFAPLDWGAAHAGASTMEVYRPSPTGSGRWEQV